MTNAKRFRYNVNHNSIEDNGKFKAFVNTVDARRIVDLLNELDEKYVDEFSLRETLHLELQRVEEENKQLKQQLSHIEYRFTEYRIKRGRL